MINLQVDSKRKSIRLELELKGETEPIKVSIPSYSFVQEGEKTFIEFGQIQVSREWMQAVADTCLKGKRLEVPSALKIVL